MTAAISGSSCFARRQRRRTSTATTSRAAGMSKGARLSYDFPKLNLTASAAEIRKETSNIIKTYEQQVGTVIQEKSTRFEATFQKLADADGDAAFKSITCVLPSLVAGSEESRAAGMESKSKLNEMWANMYSSRELFQLLCACKDTDMTPKTAQQTRLMDVVLQRFIRNGANLTDEKQFKEFSEHMLAIKRLESECEQCINEDTTEVAFEKIELDGLSESFLEALPMKDGKYMVSVKAPTRMPVMQQAHSSETRRKMSFHATSICKENEHRLNKILMHRHKAARLSGYPNHAALMLAGKTAGTVQEATAFLDNIIKRLRPKYKAEMERLRAANGGQEVKPWDILYLVEKVKKEEAGIDTEHLRKYFPLHATLDNILGIYADLLGLKIVRSNSLPKWSDEVLTFEVHDGQNGEGGLKGYIYLDLFPRKGKYGHQMILPLSPTFDGCLPACLNLGNLTRPEGDGEAMLRLDEVRTIFHEMGHAMHCVCTKTDYSILSWAWPMVPWYGGVEQDFLEVPSTMFEQWMLQEDVVKRVSSVASDGSTMDTEIVKKLSDYRHFLEIAKHLMRVYALMVADMRMHTLTDDQAASPDSKKIYEDALFEFADVKLLDGTNASASWYHMVNGYDAGYYGYTWAEAYAQDLFSEFKSKGLFDRATGQKLRKAILEPCATLPANDMLQQFLQRPPSIDPYLEDLGIADGACDEPAPKKLKVEPPPATL